MRTASRAELHKSMKSPGHIVFRDHATPWLTYVAVVTHRLHSMHSKAISPASPPAIDQADLKLKTIILCQSPISPGLSHVTTGTSDHSTYILFCFIQN